MPTPSSLVPSSSSLCILGIDPGSRTTGYGVVALRDGKSTWLASGCIRLQGPDLATRLCSLLEGLETVLDTHDPDVVAVEQVFMHRNADSALKLGQARGAAVGLVARRKLPVYEYTPAQIKKTIVGRGNAAKAQIQHMICAMLGLDRAPQEDAADALAVALCHAHMSHTLTRMRPARGLLQATRRTRRGRLR